MSVHIPTSRISKPEAEPKCPGSSGASDVYGGWYYYWYYEVPGQ